VLSDGGDNASRQSLDDVLLNARQSNATIYTIDMYDESDRDQDPRTLRKIADLSGGRAVLPLGARRPGARLARHRRRYSQPVHRGVSLQQPDRDGSFRKGDVAQRYASWKFVHETTS
jgi:hypothetical protein